MRKRTYWNGRAPLYGKNARLSEALVPSVGAASTTHGNLLRAANRIYYDYYNNGFANVDLDLYVWFALTLRLEAENIDGFGSKSFHGTVAVLGPVIEAGRTRMVFRPNAPSVWPHQFELFMDAVTLCVESLDNEEKSRLAQAQSDRAEFRRALEKSCEVLELPGSPHLCDLPTVLARLKRKGKLIL